MSKYVNCCKIKTNRTCGHTQIYIFHINIPKRRADEYFFWIIPFHIHFNIDWSNWENNFNWSLKVPIKNGIRVLKLISVYNSF